MHPGQQHRLRRRHRHQPEAANIVVDVQVKQAAVVSAPLGVISLPTSCFICICTVHSFVVSFLSFLKVESFCSLSNKAPIIRVVRLSIPSAFELRRVGTTYCCFHSFLLLLLIVARRRRSHEKKLEADSVAAAYHFVHCCAF